MLVTQRYSTQAVRGPAMPDRATHRQRCYEPSSLFHIVPTLVVHSRDNHLECLHSHLCAEAFVPFPHFRIALQPERISIHTNRGVCVNASVQLIQLVTWRRWQGPCSGCWPYASWPFSSGPLSKVDCRPREEAGGELSSERERKIGSIRRAM
jgi:hypothetical protein